MPGTRIRIRRNKQRAQTNYVMSSSDGTSLSITRRLRLPWLRLEISTGKSPAEDGIVLRAVRKGPFIAGFEALHDGERLGWIPNSLFNRAQWSLRLSSVEGYRLVAEQKVTTGWLAATLLGLVPFLEGLKGSNFGREFALQLETPNGLREGSLRIVSDAEVFMELPDVADFPFLMTLTALFAVLVWEQQ